MDDADDTIEVSVVNPSTGETEVMAITRSALDNARPKRFPPRGGGGGPRTTRQSQQRSPDQSVGQGTSFMSRLYSERKCFKCEKPNHTAQNCRSKTKADGSALNVLPDKKEKVINPAANAVDLQAV